MSMYTCINSIVEVDFVSSTGAIFEIIATLIIARYSGCPENIDPVQVQRRWRVIIESHPAVNPTSSGRGVYFR